MGAGASTSNDNMENSASLEGIIEYAKVEGKTLNLASTAGTEEDDEGLLYKYQLDKLLDIPIQVFDCTLITCLYLKQNKLCTIPAEIRQLVNLTNLNVSENKLLEIPAEIGELKALETLDISENNEGPLKELPPTIGGCSALTTLIAFKNAFSALPEEIGFCTELVEINLYNNKLIRLPKSMSGLVKMENLNVGGNKLKTIVSTDAWTSMEEFKCHQNNLVMCPTFEKMTSLKFLKIDMNRALRELPKFGNYLISLEHLECNMCDLESLPDDIKSMASLKILNVQSNRIPVLPEIALPELEILNISTNKLTAIPDSIASCPKLRVFFFNGNQVSEIPESMARLKRLERCMTCAMTGSNDMTGQVRAVCESNQGWLKELQ